MSGFHRAVGLILNRSIAYIPISMDGIALTAYTITNKLSLILILIKVFLATNLIFEIKFKMS